MIQIFYHEKDLDGWTSAAITYYYHQDKEVQLIPYDYHKEKELPTLLDKNAQLIYFVDCSANPELLAEYDNLIIIDHHKSFIEKTKDYSFNGILDINYAGCELVWDFFYPDWPVPNFVYLLGRYDIWDNSDSFDWNELIMPFQMFMRLSAKDPIQNFNYWKEKIDEFFNNNYMFLEDWLKEGITQGKTILEYQKNEDRKIATRNSFEAIFEGYNVIALNNTRTNSQVFDSIWDESKYDLMLMWYNIKGEKFTVSLYTTKDDIDVSLIAKEFGGGGHKQAAGFVCRDVIIDKKEITIV